MANRLYPIGIQTFADIVSDNYVYVDKTKYVYDLTHQYRYVFLSRPRRFGKSLLVSTLESYFEGRKDLFKGLAIDELEKDWAEYPVFHFDMSDAKNKDIEGTKKTLHCMVRRYEEKYGQCPDSDGFADRLRWLFETAYNKTGRKVVILIDEYDSPMLNVIDDDTKLEEFRSLLRSFYSPIKSCDRYIRFGFITGITKFSQLSIFSEINNLVRISMLDQWSGICGITEKELQTVFDEDIEDLGRYLGISKEETFAKLKKQYDGYHFSKNSEDVYNPYSLITALCNKEIDSHWFETATPRWLIEQLRKFKFKIEDLEGTDVPAESFDAPTENMKSALPLLFQSGYFTIKGYDKRFGLYFLTVPNNEVRIGLTKQMAYYLLPTLANEDSAFIGYFSRAICGDKVSDALRLMRSFIAGIPYVHLQQNELSYHTIFYIVAKLLLQFVDTEIQSSAGRSDMVIKTETHIYVIEFKFNGSLDKAMLQIDKKGYLIPYECDGRKLVKVAVNFNETIRTIDGWRIEREDGETEEWLEGMDEKDEGSI